jgi:hypothetical protein
VQIIYLGKKFIEFVGWNTTGFHGFEVLRLNKRFVVIFVWPNERLWQQKYSNKMQYTENQITVLLQ